MKKSVVLAVLLALCGSIVFSGCGSSAPRRNVYRIAASFDPADMSVTGEVEFEYRNDTETEIGELEFNLFGRAYREGAAVPLLYPSSAAAAYPDGPSYGDMTVGDVTDGTGKALGSEIAGEDENILIVRLAEGLFPGEKATVRIPFRVELAKIRHRLGYTDRAVNLGNWYPILCARTEAGYYECVYGANGDPFVSDCADYRVEFTCPADYVLAASGEEISSAQADGRTTHVLSLDCARDFALVLSRDFLVRSEDVGGCRLSYYYYDDERADETFRTAKDSLNYFSGVFAEYPYPAMSVVQTSFHTGGMEYPALVYITDAAKGKEIDEIVAHENAHQWWYGIVGNNQVEHAWMDEGLAEYSAALFFDAHPGYGLTLAALADENERAYRAALSALGKLYGEADTRMDRNLRSFSSEFEYVGCAYRRGFLLFDSVRQSVGEKRFFAALRRYAKDCAYRIASPADLMGSFEREGADTDGLFESWIEGKVSFVE